MTLIRRVAVVIVVAVAAVVLGTGGAQAAPPPFRLPPLPEPIATWLRPPVPPAKRLSDSWVTAEKSIRKAIPGQVGVALVPVGSDVAQSFGSLKTGRAWSTVKVPVALAAERKNGAAVLAKEDKAITFSDNDAAGDLWGSLGGGKQSVDAVTSVLREGHDMRTRVSSEIDTPRSYPGYTPWALVDQARFGAHLPCMPNTDNILSHMGSVAPNQRWGIADLGPKRHAVTAVKGGWGPATDASPGYLVRQLGLISTDQGEVAIAMAARPRSGKLDDGTKMLTRIGDWLGRNFTSIPAGKCGLL
nr:hypothetical protein [Gordonia otitidis]